MMIKKAFGTSLKVVFSVLLLSGCASSIFPDFADDTEVVIDEGGKVEVRKINSNGILVADKENAVYEDENNETAVFEQKPDVIEVVVPAETVKIEAEKLDPVIVVSDNKAPKEVEKVVDETEIVTEPAPASNVVTKEEKYIESEDDKVVPSMYYLAETIYFDNGSAVVDHKFYNAVKKIAKVAKANDAVISVFGYASSRTRNTDPVSHKLANFKVSAERADNVAKLLRKYGIKADRINIHALSDSMPAYQEVMPEGERLNRRVEIFLTY
mgnify:CR=1 FL=1